MRYTAHPPPPRPPSHAHARGSRAHHTLVNARAWVISCGGDVAAASPRSPHSALFGTQRDRVARPPPCLTSCDGLPCPEPAAAAAAPPEEQAPAAEAAAVEGGGKEEGGDREGGFNLTIAFSSDLHGEVPSPPPCYPPLSALLFSLSLSLSLSLRFLLSFQQWREGDGRVREREE